MLWHAAPLVQEQARGGLDNLDGLKRGSEDLLYEKTMGCDDKFMLLHSVLELLKLKAKNGSSDITDLLVLLRDMFPKPNKLPCNNYRAKKLIAPLAWMCKKYSRVRTTASYTDEILPWKDMYQLRYNRRFNLYRSNMTLYLRKVK